MELNLAAWEDASRNRAQTASDQEIADRAITAMGEDLDLVLYLLEQSGFFLDDHYRRVRDVLRGR